MLSSIRSSWLDDRKRFVGGGQGMQQGETEGCLFAKEKGGDTPTKRKKRGREHQQQEMRRTP